MIKELLWIIGLTLMPFLELRASIPYGILTGGFPWYVVFLIAVVVNILLGVILYFLIDFLVKIFTRIKWIDKIWQKYVEKTQKKVHRAMEKYGELGLAIFIGIPLPGSGVYTGCIGAYLLGIDFKRTIRAVVIGVLIAATAVTIITVTGSTAFSFLLK